jgi:putative sterol carrier protein
VSVGPLFAEAGEETFMRSGPIGAFRRGDPLVQFFTKAYFDEVAKRLNEDEEWTKKAGGLTTKITLICPDRDASYMLAIEEGQVTALDVAPEDPADFKFEGPWDSWMKIGKGEADFQTLVLTGKMKFRGSMPKIMGMMGQLGRLTQVAVDIPKEF